MEATDAAHNILTVVALSASQSLSLSLSLGLTESISEAVAAISLAKSSSSLLFPLLAFYFGFELFYYTRPRPSLNNT